MRWLKSWFKGGADELGWDDLVRRAARAIADTAQYGARGRIAFPAEVEVTVSVPAGDAELARDFVGRPEFDAEVAADVANRSDCAAADLPHRSYRVAEGPRVAARARGVEATSRWVLVIEGGDLDGRSCELPAGRAELCFGRGEWHGGDRQVRNDLVVSAACEFVSRRAGRLHCAGVIVEVEPLDQGDFLVVRRAGGESLRPARSARGRAPLRAGDAIELVDGDGHSVRLVLERRES